jgi:hypothetical protein
MADSPVLTDNAKFKCVHMPAPLGVTEGISISLKASKISVDNAKPILNGAEISGFTPASGCTFQISGVATPCISFPLSLVPATGLLDEGGQKVYLAAESPAIAAVPSKGNGIPGLTIIETQIKLKA